MECGIWKREDGSGPATDARVILENFSRRMAEIPSPKMMDLFLLK